MARRVVAATVALAALGLIVSCSGSDDTREYDVPRALCGVSVDPGLVSPFLPAGKKIRMSETRPVPSRKNCRADVDGKWALMANLEWWSEDTSSSTVASGNPQLEEAQLSPDGNFYSGTGAVALVKGCKNPHHAQQLLFTSLRVRDSDLGDISTMKKLATTYTEAVGRSDECP
ncbi:hypothetical protein ACFY71_23235 [Streptomyces cinerochromogenes]|uniref:hypothetical protein n=1 Tax=Streptomyces cinerochromogenes TaxID=66422 RepID=UPI00368C4693